MKFPDNELIPGCFRFEHLEQARHQWDVPGRNHAQMQAAPHLPGFTPQFFKEILQLAKKRACMFLKDKSSGSEQNSFSPALKKRDAQGRFQVSSLLRNTRLRNAKPVRRATEAARLGHSRESRGCAGLRASARVGYSGGAGQMQLGSFFARSCFHQHWLSTYIRCLTLRGSNENQTPRLTRSS